VELSVLVNSGGLNINYVCCNGFSEYIVTYSLSRFLLLVRELSLICEFYY
jgi:hypothetical protein